MSIISLIQVLFIAFFIYVFRLGWKRSLRAMRHFADLAESQRQAALSEKEPHHEEESRPDSVCVRAVGSEGVRSVEPLDLDFEEMQEEADQESLSASDLDLSPEGLRRSVLMSEILKRRF